MSSRILGHGLVPSVSTACLPATTVPTSPHSSLRGCVYACVSIRSRVALTGVGLAPKATVGATPKIQYYSSANHEMALGRKGTNY